MLQRQHEWMRAFPIESLDEPLLNPISQVPVGVEIVGEATFERFDIDFILGDVLVEPHHMLDIALLGQSVEMTREIAIISLREKLSANGALGQR